jgi:hypothetical protein
MAAKRYRIATQHGYVDGDYATKAQARKDLANIVKGEAATCRQRHNRCSVIGTSKSGSVEIKIGGRQGYHLWDRFIINESR